MANKVMKQISFKISPTLEEALYDKVKKDNCASTSECLNNILRDYFAAKQNNYNIISECLRALQTQEGKEMIQGVMHDALREFFSTTIPRK